MAKIYTKYTWLDEVLASDPRYNILTNVGVPIYSNTAIELATGITVAGTPLAAVRMNNIENGIDALDTLVAALEPRADLMAQQGWVAAGGTWNYVSADSPSFVVNVTNAIAATLNVGWKIRLTQTTLKHFIITFIGTPGATYTPVTLFGGYGASASVLANAAITLPYFSIVNRPFGFPPDKTTWRASMVDTVGFSQASPTINVWYNAHSLVIPIGQWRVVWEGHLQVQITTAGTAVIAGFGGALSTINNGDTDTELTARYTFSMPNTLTNATGRASVHKEKILTLASKTTFYLNIVTGVAGLSAIALLGSVAPTMIYAECVYF